MKGDWLHKVHDRMADFEIQEPDGLWEAIDTRQPRIAPVSHNPWLKRSLSAAAAIVLLFSVGIYFARVPENLSAPELPQETQHIAPAEAPANHTAHNNIPAAIKHAVSSTYVRIPADTRSETPDDMSVDESVAEPSDTPTEPTDTLRHRLPSSPVGNDYIAAVSHKATPSNSLSVSVFSSGGTGLASKGALLYDSYDSPVFSNGDQIPPAERELDIVSDIRHRLPIRAGITFAYNFSSRLAIESGITYAMLASDVEGRTGKRPYSGVQRLQYIGIPLNLKLRAFTWKRIDIYASAGALAEKCVSAKVSKDYMLPDRQKQHETASLSQKPMQWSVNAALGVQYRFVTPLSIFVEPGISYYFDDHSTLETIYTDHPLNFNLTLGLRLTLPTR
ncbi:MAG: outer membrane beta-barrel protein [Muribaculaceae bacterium]|nr:outer membrane beta-barrel protein [Muribaculaceae bacterium]